MVRRTVVSLAITLAAVILVQVVTPTLIRPHLLAPTEKYIVATADNIRGFGLSGDGPNPRVIQMEVASGAVGAWKLSDKTVDKSGKTVSSLPSWVIDCAPAPPAADGATVSSQGSVPDKAAACYQRLADEGYRQHIKYFTADRFWDLQWREFGFFLLLALALTGFSFWRIRRDLS